VNTDVVTLTVLLKPQITTQPKSVTVSVGNTATFTVKATDAVSYQWYYSKDQGVNWIAVRNNGTSATYKLKTEARHDGYQYRCTVTNANGSADTDVVTLTVTQ
jgi:hypothetical protein